MPRDIPLGNGKLLITFDRYYRIRDIYFPHVGKENQTVGHPWRFGVWVDGQLSWMGPDWQISLKYEDGTMVTRVEAYHPGLKVRLVCADAVDFHDPVYVRKIIVRNLADRERDIRLFINQDFQPLGATPRSANLQLSGHLSYEIVWVQANWDTDPTDAPTEYMHAYWESLSGLRFSNNQQFSARPFRRIYDVYVPSTDGGGDGGNGDGGDDGGDVGGDVIPTAYFYEPVFADCNDFIAFRSSRTHSSILLTCAASIAIENFSSPMAFAPEKSQFIGVMVRTRSSLSACPRTPHRA